MYRRLPPLNAVRAFEAAARLESFTAAAAELGVTHGAVSRQVQILEDWLGLPLFQRANRRVSLTRDGQDYRTEASAMLDRLALATERIARRQTGRVLRVNASQTFTMRWLIPRLPAFAQAHPAIEVRLTASIVPVENLTEPFDSVIRRTPMVKSGFISTPFLHETCTPVASPKLLERIALPTPSALRHHTWLHADSLKDLWPAWLAAAGLPEMRADREMRFEHLYYALQAAVDGVGLAMGPSALVADDLATGRLVAPLASIALPLGAFHVLTPGAAKGHEAAAIFRRWLLAQSAPGG